MLLTLALLLNTADASVDPACEGKTQLLDDQGQQDYLLNYFALSTTLSPNHAPVPHDPGRASIGVDFGIIPPLSCERRLVLDSSKTEDTNKAPMAPRPRVIFSGPQIGPMVPYAGAVYVPPVTVFGTRNVILSGELGVGVYLPQEMQTGVRFHATMMKTVADIATPFEEGDPSYDDVFSGSTFGFDAMFGRTFGPVTPYIALGMTDVSTFFYIGETGYVGLNETPYFGFTGSAGAHATFKDHIDVSGEFYTAPGYLYTGRVRVAWVFGPIGGDAA